MTYGLKVPQEGRCRKAAAEYECPWQFNVTFIDIGSVGIASRHTHFSLITTIAVPELELSLRLDSLLYHPVDVLLIALARVHCHWLTASRDFVLAIPPAPKLEDVPNTGI
jgi:hypothetical protein